MYTRESLEELRTLIDPKDVLIGIGGVNPKYISDSGGEIRCPCPIHGGDNPSAFSWNRHEGFWTCFTRDCGANVNRDLFGFVALKLGVGFNEAALELSNRFGILLNSENKEKIRPDYSLLKIKEHNQVRKFVQSNTQKLETLPGYYKEGFPEVVKYIESRNYNKEVIRRFNLYPSIDTFDMLRVSIPIYDEYDTLVGVNSRIMNTILHYPEQVHAPNGRLFKLPKYKMTSFTKAAVLYNLNKAKEVAAENGIIVVEGQFDVIRLYTLGWTNAVACLGTSLSTEQSSLISKYCMKVIFLVEEGEAAIKGVRKSIKNLPETIKIYIAKLPHGDADSNSKETITNALENAKTLTLSEITKIKNGVDVI